MYYNPKTNEQLDKKQLCKNFGMSIPNGYEEVNGWYLIHDGERPASTRNSYVSPSDNIIKSGEHYVQEYVVKDHDQHYLESITRRKRDELINDLQWRIERASDQEALGVATIDDKAKLIEYRQYLRDYPGSKEDWYKEDPLGYDEWLKK